MLGEFTQMEADFAIFRARYLERFGGDAGWCRGFFNRIWAAVRFSSSEAIPRAARECLRDLDMMPPAEAMRIFDAKIAYINGKMAYDDSLERYGDMWNVFTALNKHLYAEAAGIVARYRPDLRPDAVRPLIEYLMDGVTDEDEIRHIRNGLFTIGWYGPR